MANWYLDAAATGSNNGTSWTNAWHGTDHVVWGASGVKAGDTLYVATGSYAAMTVGASGTSDSARITIRASQDTHTGVATFNGANAAPALTANGRDYITIDGQYGTSRNFTFENGILSGGRGDYYNGVVEFGYDTTPGTGNRLLYATLQHAQCGVIAHNIGQGTLEVGYCYFYDVFRQAGIDVGTGWTGRPQAFGVVAIHHNEFYFPVWMGGDGAPVGIDCIQGMSGVDVYNNIFHGYYQNYAVDAQHPDAIQAQGDYWRIYNNLFYDCGDGIIDFDMFTAGNGKINHVWVYNNEFNRVGLAQNDRPWYARFYSITTQINDFLFANNTVVDCHDFVPFLKFYQQVGTYNPTITNTLIQNNLFYNSGVASGGSGYQGIMDAQAASNYTAANFNFDYNLTTAGANGSSAVYIDGSLYTQAHPRTGTPQFISYGEHRYTTQQSIGGGLVGTNNFRLQAGDTVCRGQGVDLSAYFTTDKDNNPRTGAWSIGAYQGSGSNPPTGTPTLSVR